MRLALNDYTDALNYLDGYSKSGAPVADLSRFSRLCERLGDPQRGLRCIHIAGTNGKGSTTEYITRALCESGYVTGRFTSPYIIDIRERITLCGEYIGEGDFTRLMGTVAAAVEECSDKAFSQFEILTAVCFLWFREKGADYCVIEAGIGGTLDCTNVIPQPRAAVITSIGLDHTAILGGTEAEIAQSKCGIIKGGVCVCGADIPSPAMRVIEKRCTDTGAKLILPDLSELRVKERGAGGSSFCYKGCDYRVNMCGAHQITNALTAVEVLLSLGDEKVTGAAIQRGLESAVLPARMQRLSACGREYIIDGGHNPQALMAARAALGDIPGEKTAVIGMLASKDFAAMPRIMAGCFENVVYVDGFAANTVPSERLYELSSGHIPEVRRYFLHDVEKALALAEELSDGGTVFVGGSLYLASEVLRLLRERESGCCG